MDAIWPEQFTQITVTHMTIYHSVILSVISSYTYSFALYKQQTLIKTLMHFPPEVTSSTRWVRADLCLRSMKTILGWRAKWPLGHFNCRNRVNALTMTESAIHVSRTFHEHLFQNFHVGASMSVISPHHGCTSWWFWLNIAYTVSPVWWSS